MNQLFKRDIETIIANHLCDNTLILEAGETLELIVDKLFNIQQTEDIELLEALKSYKTWKDVFNDTELCCLLVGE